MRAASRPWGLGNGPVCVVNGFAVRIFVERGHLVVRDGVGACGRERVYGRATHRLKRLVLLGHSGSLSLDAVRWLSDVGVGFVQVDTDGRILSASSGLGLDDPRLRRAQAMAWGSQVGLAIAREILRRKLAGQARIARRRGRDDVAASIERIVPALDASWTPAELLIPEAAAASAYWSAWAPIELRWAKADLAPLPSHWRTFGSRASPLTGNSRSAANPANAILNYLYALLEAEARLASLAVGLDPGLGVLHTDRRARDSLALDVMEAVRPDVDEFVLELLEQRTFRRSDFFETRQGVCRILPPLSHELAQTTTAWATRLGPVVEWVAKALSAGAGSGTRRVPTPMTGANRSAGRGVYARAIRTAAAAVATTCVVCGGPTRRGRMTCSDPCEAAQRQENPNLRFVEAGRANLARLRDSGWQRRLSEDGRQRLRRGSHERIAAAREWQRSHPWPADMAEFGREIAPLLAAIGPGALQQATGLSPAYLRQIVRGAVVPHPMWWESLRAAAAQAM